MEAPKLKNLEKFERLLDAYHPSDETIKAFQNLRLVLLVGPTASGRNTLINLLTKTEKYKYIVSHTTRKPRINNGVQESDGVEYWFDSEEKVLEDLEKGLYLEAAIIHRQQVSGIHIRELISSNSSSQIGINEIEVAGADSVHSFNQNCYFIFLLPPSFDVWLQRIKGRGEMSDIELKRRLESAENEIETALNRGYYKFVINNEIHDAADRVDQMVSGEMTYSDEEQKAGRRHAEQLVIDVKQFLRS